MEILFILFLVLPAIGLALSIWVTVRGVQAMQHEEVRTKAIVGIILTWVIFGLGWIPGFFLTASPEN